MSHLLPARAAAGCTTGSPRPLGAHLQRNAVLGLCPLLRSDTLARLCSSVHTQHGLPKVSFGVENFGEDPFHALGRIRAKGRTRRVGEAGPTIWYWGPAPAGVTPLNSVGLPAPVLSH